MPYNEKGSLVLPTEILRVFEPWMLDAMVDAARIGATRNEIVLATGLSKRKFVSFLNPNSTDYMEDFDDAYQMAAMVSQAFWEGIGRNAAQGAIDKHSASSYQFIMKGNFKDTYRDEKTIELDVATIPSISPTLSPVEAGQAYKQLLLQSSLGDFFDE